MSGAMVTTQKGRPGDAGGAMLAQEPTMFGFSDRTWTFVLTCMFVCMGLALRAHEAHATGLWNDELHTVQIASRPSIRQQWELVAGDRHPPLYYVFSSFAYRTSSGTDFALKYSSTVFYLALFLYGCIAWRKHRQTAVVAMLSVALLSFNVCHIYFSTQARMYSLLMALLAVLALELIASMERGTDPPCLRIAILCVLSVYTHYVGWLAVGALLASYVILSGWRRKALISATKIAGMVTLCSVPYAGVLLTHIARPTPYDRDLATVLSYFRYVYNGLWPALCLAVGFFAVSKFGRGRLGSASILPWLAAALFLAIGWVSGWLLDASILVLNSFTVVVVLGVIGAAGVLARMTAPSQAIVLMAMFWLSLPALYVHAGNPLEFGSHRGSFRELVRPVLPLIGAGRPAPIVLHTARPREAARYLAELRQALPSDHLILVSNLRIADEIFEQTSRQDVIVLTRGVGSVRHLQNEFSKRGGASRELAPGAVIFYRRFDAPSGPFSL